MESGRHQRLLMVDRMLLCDIDNTLIGDDRGLSELMARLDKSPGHIGFGVATGRRLESVIAVLKEWNVPAPDVIVSSVGTEIYYGKRAVADIGWRQHLDYRWQPREIQAVLKELPGLKLQPKDEQRQFKISYLHDLKKAPGVKEIKKALRQKGFHANVVYSHQAFLDVLPIRASKGAAVRYLGIKWGLPLERFLVAGDSGNDEEMLCGDTLGVVVGNYSKELLRLRGRDKIFFAKGAYAWGVLEGAEHYGFLDL